MSRQQLSWALALALVASDVAMIVLALVVAYILRFRTGIMAFQEAHPWAFYQGLAVLESLLLPFVFAVWGLYRFRRNVSRLDELKEVFTAVSIGTVLTWALSAFLTRDFAYSRALMAFAWMGTVFLVWLARLAQLRLHAFFLSRGVAEERVVIVGTGEMGQAILEKIRGSPGWGYRAVGFMAEDHEPPQAGDAGLPVLGTLADVTEVVERHRITDLIIAAPALSQRDVMEILARCQGKGVTIQVFPDVFQMMSSAPTISDLNGLPMIMVRDAALRGWRLGVKRVVDVVISAVLLVFLSPLLLLVALLIKLTSPSGPVFYIQERVGLDNVPFPMIKLRSMSVDAEVETGPVWAQQRDPRASPFGRFLRRYSLDELPQFINVLLGQMSIVGPRPERPHFVEQFEQQVPRYLERHREKAGLTGWAQVNGLRGNTSVEERTAYDLWYVENWTLWLDFKIMLRTLLAIFRENNG